MNFKKNSNIVVKLPIANHLQIAITKNVLDKTSQRSLEDHEEKNLKLSHVLYENSQFEIHRTNFIKDESDLQILKDAEKHLYKNADFFKLQKFDFINQRKVFPDYETLRLEIKEKTHIPNIEKNKYFFTNSKVDLDEILINIPEDKIEEIKNIILQTYNFFSLYVEIEQLSKMIITVYNATSIDDNITYYFTKIGAIAIMFGKTWWDKELYKNQWTSVSKNGLAFIHEFAHVISIFTQFSPAHHFEINSLNIKNIFMENSSREWDFDETFIFFKIRDINRQLHSKEDALNCDFEKGIARKFSDFIFSKIIYLLNRGIDRAENMYDECQPVHRYFMLICALIPSNYARLSIIKSNVNKIADIRRAIDELFAEAILFLLGANDNEKNIFWEWTYDFIVGQNTLKDYFIQ